MNVLITPTRLSGSITIPPSKSQSHRAIIAASLSKGKSVINNVLLSEDVIATISAMQKLGVKIVQNNHQLIIQGISRINVADDNFVDCNESGSTLRFLIPILSLSRQKIVITGKPGLLKRPMTIYEQMFKDRGLFYQQTDKSIIISGSLPSDNYQIPGNVSSQFISGLLFALPLQKEDSKIEILGDLESKEYVDMTVSVLKHFGITIHENGNEYIIPGNQQYKPAHLTIEGDYSQMAFFATAGLLGGDIHCLGMSKHSQQPDQKYLNFVEKMNGRFTWNNSDIVFHHSDTFGTSIDVSQSPDIAPILAVLGALSSGTTIIENAARLKYKESNRLSSTYETLKKMNIEVQMTDSSLIIEGKNTIDGGVFDSYNDHRIVMAIAIAAIKSNQPVTIKNAEAVNKSYPTFFHDYQNLGGNVTFIEE